VRIATSAFGDDGNLPQAIIGLLGGGGSRRKGSSGKKRRRKQVADAINELIKNEELRKNMSNNNKRLAVQFSQNKSCDEMGEVFMSL